MARLPKTLTLLILMAFVMGACAPKTANPAGSENPGLANPASVNCDQAGGKSEIKTRPDGGQYGVCVFADNRQCDEWALFRGDCPAGGVEIQGLVTDAAVFCAINGGDYTVTGKNGASDEQGTCQFKNAKVCDAWEFFNGTCSASE